MFKRRGNATAKENTANSVHKPISRHFPGNVVRNPMVSFRNMCRPQKSTLGKIRIGISHINPLIMKPNMMGYAHKMLMLMCVLGP